MMRHIKLGIFLSLSSLQAQTNCYSTPQSSITVPAAGTPATGLQVTGTSPCQLPFPPSGKVTSNNNWITVKSDQWGAYGSSGVFTIAVAANAGLPRTGSVVTGNLTFTIRQLGAAATVPVSGPAVPQLAALDTKMLALLKEFGDPAGALPGGALAVSYQGRLVYARGFGYADLSTLESVQPDSIFRLASISKLITVAAYERLVSTGRLNPNTGAVGLLGLSPPPGQQIHSDWSTMTVAHLRDMKAGFLTTGGDRALDYDYGVAAAQAVGIAMPGDINTRIRYALGQKLDYTPGSAPCANPFNPPCYSNFEYQILGRVIERASGKTFANFVQDELMSPAGVTRIRPAKSFASQKWPGEVSYLGHPSELMGQSVFPSLPGYVPLTYGAYAYELLDSFGGMTASAPDLLRFYRMWSRGYYFNGSLTGTNTSVFFAEPFARDLDVAVLFNFRSNYARTTGPSCSVASPCDLATAAQKDVLGVLAGITDFPEGNLYPTYSLPSPACTFDVPASVVAPVFASSVSLTVNPSRADCGWSGVADPVSAPGAGFDLQDASGNHNTFSAPGLTGGGAFGADIHLPSSSSGLPPVAGGQFIIAGRPVTVNPARVDLFEHTSYGGQQLTLAADEPWVGPVWNDRISSLKVAAGWGVTLFADAWYAADAKAFAGDVPNLGVAGSPACFVGIWSDCASSVKIFPLAGMTITASGGGQSALASVSFGQPLQALVKDRNGNPVAGVDVLFQAVAEATSVPTVKLGPNSTQTFVARTNLSGIATAAVRAGSWAGKSLVTISFSYPALTGQTSAEMTNLAGKAAAITVVSGTPQSAHIGTAFTTRLEGTVKDPFGNPVAIPLAFTPPASGASATLSNAGYDAATGSSWVTATANGVAGTYNVTATEPGGVRALFALTNTAKTLGTITITGGNNQSAMVGTVFAAPLQVTVKYTDGTVAEGARVEFGGVDTGFAGAALAPNLTFTNASGIASSTATASTTSSVTGMQSPTGKRNAYGIAARLCGPGPTGCQAPIQTVFFDMTNTPGAPAKIAAVSGTPQSATVGAPFTLPLRTVVRDIHDNAILGVNVTYAAPAAGTSAVLSSTTANTGTQETNPYASVTATANGTPGSYTVTASAPGVATAANFTLANTAAVPGTITASAGTPQSAAVGTPFGAALTALVRDAANNPVSGVTVTFTAPAPGASAVLSSATATTNASGVASVTATANGSAGAYSVSASAPGVAAPASFSLTNTPAPGSIAASGGTPQSAVAGAAFRTPLSAAVKDIAGNPVSGVTVSFTPPASGASAVLSAASAVTNSNGIASVQASANTVPGAYNVTAAVAGVAQPALFALTNTGGSGLPAPSVTSPTTSSVVTGSVVLLQWTAVPNATRYELRLIEANTPQQFRVEVLAPDTYAVYTLPSGSYREEIRACDANGCGVTGSSSFTVRPPAIPSQPVTGLACTPRTAALECSWDSRSGADFYFLNVVQPGAGPGGGALTVAGRQVSQFENLRVTVSVPAGAMSVVVRACTGDGCGPFTAPLSVIVGGSPSAPTLGEPFSGSAVDGSPNAPAVTFTWNRIAGDTGNVTYRLYVQDFSRNAAALDILTKDNFYAAYFNPGTRYDALVIADNGTTSAQGPPSVFVTRGRPPKSPVATAPAFGSAVTVGSPIPISWTPLVDSDGTNTPRRYQYFFSGPARQTSGIVDDTTTFLTFSRSDTGQWLGTMRACLTGLDCTATSPNGWGPWNNETGSEGGMAAFTVR